MDRKETVRKIIGGAVSVHQERDSTFVKRNEEVEIEEWEEFFEGNNAEARKP